MGLSARLRARFKRGASGEVEVEVRLRQVRAIGTRPSSESDRNKKRGVAGLANSNGAESRFAADMKFGGGLFCREWAPWRIFLSLAVRLVKIDAGLEAPFEDLLKIKVLRKAEAVRVGQFARRRL